MKSLIKDESADSMILVVIALSILSFGLFFILLTYTFNSPITAMNGLISDGMITQDTADAYNLCLDLWKVTPFFMLLGLILFCYERIKGTSVSAQTFFEYLFLMIVGTYITINMVYAYGIALDGITINLDKSILTDVSADWDVTSDRLMIIKMLYYFTFLPAFVSCVLYILNPILKQRETRFVYDREPEEDFGDIELGQV